MGVLILVWLLKEAIDFVRVKADNKRVDRSGFEVSRSTVEVDTCMLSECSVCWVDTSRHSSSSAVCGLAKPPAAQLLQELI